MMGQQGQKEETGDEAPLHLLFCPQVQKGQDYESYKRFQRNKKPDNIVESDKKQLMCQVASMIKRKMATEPFAFNHVVCGLHVIAINIEPRSDQYLALSLNLGHLY